jgi:hypothetical protein
MEIVTESLGAWEGALREIRACYDTRIQVAGRHYDAMVNRDHAPLVLNFRSCRSPGRSGPSPGPGRDCGPLP